MTRPEVPEPSEYIAVLPAGQRLVVELGNRLPDEGTLRVRVRASRVSTEPNLVPSSRSGIRLAGETTDSKASFRISSRDLVIDASPGKPMFYQWDIPLSEIYPRNPVRKTEELGATKTDQSVRIHSTAQHVVFSIRGHTVRLRRGVGSCLRAMAARLAYGDFHRQ